MAVNTDRNETPSQEKRDDEVFAQEQRGDLQIELVRIVERGRSIRWISVCACIAVGVIALVIGVVLIASKPEWWQLVLLIIAGLAAPSVVAGWAINSRVHYVKKHKSRMVDMELSFDAKRTSSESKGSNET